VEIQFAARFIDPIVYLSPVGFPSDDPLINRGHGSVEIDEDRKLAGVIF
jgi:hypothetical protein